ncbi:hypothetical protein CFAM422_009017 [Trichoderma lentiforme]|uniref:Uncharacterized protein n=1 Tax=Trichoderma lentiforme TaxID=1567552 RepID=A0A9P5CC38_9HYPO|nr:hypothetical protein CFAM422_009017 [Trichoderma lentiforme]
MMQELTFPIPPTEEECKLYYYGLPRCPRLVARSSSHVWVKRQMPPGRTAPIGNENLVPKALVPCSEHPAYQLWFNPECPLQKQIIQVVSVAAWTAIDIFGVGYNDGVNEEFPATLMVTVKPGKLSWSAGYDIARRCKSILEAYNILDVECEIRESIMWYR